MSKLLDEIKTKTLTDVTECHRRNDWEIEFASRQENVLVRKVGRDDVFVHSFGIRKRGAEIGRAVTKYHRKSKELEHEISQTDKDENFDYDDEDYDGDGDFEERFLEAKKTRLDANFNYTLKWQRRRARRC